MESKLQKAYHFLCHCPGGKILFDLHLMYFNQKKERDKNKSIKNFQHHCDELLGEVEKLLSIANVKACFLFGTFLGAYREHDFIPHDVDMDLGVESEECLFQLIEASKKTMLRFHDIVLVPGLGFQHLSFSMYDIPVDFFVLNRENDSEFFTYSYDRVVDLNENVTLSGIQKCILPAFEMISMTFRGRQVLVPSCGKEFLSSVYGDDFMIPDAKHKSGSKAAKLSHYEYWERPAFRIFDPQIDKYRKIKNN